MINTFYIFNWGTESNPRWFVREKERHITMSAVESKERALECLGNIVKRYKNRKGLYQAINKMEIQHRWTTREYLQKCQGEYLAKGIEHDEDVRLVVSTALKEVIRESPVYKNKEKVKLLSSPNLVKKEVCVTKEEVVVDTPKPVRTLKGLKKLTKITRVELPQPEEEDGEE